MSNALIEHPSGTLDLLPPFPEVWDSLPPFLRRKIVATDMDSCWTWTGGHFSGGYGCVYFDGRGQYVHLLVYRMTRGYVPPDKELDHIKCDNKGCCNPYHVEAVTHRSNILRDNEGVSSINAAKTHCPRGHELEPGNLVLARLRRGKRECLICSREQGRLLMQARRAKVRAIQCQP
jgi:hypothetical protein